MLVDKKGRELKIGDLVVLVDCNDLSNDDLHHNAGDILQLIATENDNYGNFINCKHNKQTDFYADRVHKVSFKG